MKTPERDLFGHAIWDEGAFPRAWVERMQRIIVERRISQLADAEILHRGEHDVAGGEARPLTWEQAVVLQGGPLAEILLLQACPRAGVVD